MRALSVFALTTLCTAWLNAQAPCSDAAKATALRELHHAQAAVLAIKQGEMDSGVPSTAVPELRAFRAALASAADAVMVCHPATDTRTVIARDLQATLRTAAPGMPETSASAGDDATPVAGTLGNDVHGKVTELSTEPRLLGVELSSSVACGTDSQLLVYGVRDGHWERRLRWGSALGVEKGLDASSELAGDFFLTGVVHVARDANGWRVVLAHGTPWCTSRFSRIGLLVLAPSADGEGHVVWQTRRDYSRDEFVPRMTAAGDTFELRLNADAMAFDEAGFERRVIYRYRVSAVKVERLEPIALNARGFVEEWLSMPWNEAQAQKADGNNEALRRVHAMAQETGDADLYTSFAAGPVHACTTADRFQVQFDSQQEGTRAGTAGHEPSKPAQHYFALRQVPDGYQLMSVSPKPDPTCAGPDLMHEAAGRGKPH